MDSEVAELFRQIGQILTNYRSGKIPKAFKIIPTMDNWEQILEYTKKREGNHFSKAHLSELHVQISGLLRLCSRLRNFSQQTQILLCVRGLKLFLFPKHTIHVIRFWLRFYNLVLLPRIRDDIDEFKKLNYHLYNSLFKSMFKPAAFFKGILLPLCKVQLFICLPAYLPICPCAHSPEPN